MGMEDAVRSASEQFYTSLNSMLNGDAGPLSGIWSHAADVTAMHPIGGRQVGWGEVAPVWQDVAQACSDGRVTLSEQLIRVAGDMAYEVGTERGGVDLAGHRVDFEHRVTNVYRREDEAWKIIHHHTDLSPAMIEVVSGLQAEG